MLASSLFLCSLPRSLSSLFTSISLSFEPFLQFFFFPWVPSSPVLLILLFSISLVGSRLLLFLFHFSLPIFPSFLFSTLPFLPDHVLPSFREVNNRLTGWAFAHLVNYFAHPVKYAYSIKTINRCSNVKTAWRRKLNHNNFDTSFVKIDQVLIILWRLKGEKYPIPLLQ